MSENATLREMTAEEIRVLLARRKLSGSELARQVGVTQPYMSRRLNGDVAFDLDDLEKIASALGVEVTELLPRPTPGRVVASVGSQGTTPNASSGLLTIRRTRRRTPPMPCPIGGPRKDQAAPASTVSPTQRRPMLISGPGQRISA